MTAHANHQFLDRSLALPQTTFLVKPFHQLTLLAAIRSLTKCPDLLPQKQNQLTVLGKFKQKIGLSYADIVYVEADGNYIKIYTTDKVYSYKYYLFKEEMDRRGRYREASLYGDSIAETKEIIYSKERTEKLIELQAQNKQTQIAKLTLQQTQTENRNRSILVLLGIALVVAMVLGYLGWQLRQANTRLKNLTQTRDQLFGMVAHDLRRPMYAFQNIQALVGFHLRRQDYAAIEKLSVALDESGVRLQKMLDNLVAWAMSEQESLPYQPETLQVRQRVQAIVDLYAGVNPLKNVHFEINIPENLTASADPNAFDLVVRNLIDNSFKALPQAGNLHITAQAEAKAVVVEFKDNAGGIATDKVAVIQRVFDAPEKAQVGENGMGMGLITVARFVKRNYGSIGVESQIGKGTMFWVRLPKANHSYFENMER